MDHSVLTILDLGIIAAYLVIMVLVGVYSVRRIQNTKDYYVAGRSFGPMVLIIGGSGLMGRAGVAYTDGFKAVLTAIPYLLGMFIFSGIAGKISDIGMQYGITSIPELFERRFGRAAKITLSVLIAFAMMGTVASQVTATATIIRMLGGEFGLSYEMGALVIALYIHNAYNILMFAWSFYAASAGIPAFAALFWKKATKTGVMAGLLGGFVVCVGWKLAGQPFGLGAAVPGTVACGIALVVVSLATYKRAPSVFLKAEKQS